MARIRWQGLLGMALAAVVFAGGCTGPVQYVRNGFKVGPNYCPPGAATAPHWIDANDVRVREECGDLSRWWCVFRDPVLDQLIHCAYAQNLTLREAGFRILQARAQRDIAIGTLFPQQQTWNGSYRRTAISAANGQFIDPSLGGGSSRFFDTWSTSLNLNWELDFWGRFRRAIAAREDALEASVAGYDDVLVTMLGDIASNYVTIRTDQKRIELAKSNVKLQREILTIVERRFEAGRTSELDVDQARSNLENIEAAIPQLEIDLRQANNRLCVLLGIPPVDLTQQLGPGPIPTAPSDVIVGVPCDLLRRRPDVRRAERLAAAQAEQIGIAESDLYPAFTITGNVGYQARNFSDLFTPQAFNGTVGPSFQWNILNYGRIINNVRYQDYYFQELVTVYQQTVLQAEAEVENGIVVFLKAQQRTKSLDASVVDAEKAVNIVARQYNVGTVDFNRVATIEQALVQQQDLHAQAQGQIAQGLIQTYRALGGGWELRFQEQGPMDLGQMPSAEPVPTPQPAGGNAPNPPADAQPKPAQGQGQANPMPAPPTPPTPTPAPAPAGANLNQPANPADLPPRLPTDLTPVR